MDCTKAKERLSAFYDEELSSGERIAMAEHLAGCDECSRELAGFQSLSTMVDRLTDSEPPAEMWEQIEGQTDVTPAPRTTAESPAPRQAWFRRPAARFGWAVAATILLALGWLASTTRLGHDGEHQMAAVFGQYLEEFHRDPQAAQQILLAGYPGQAVDAEQAVRQVGYRPAVVDGMPEGYAVHKTYVMKMPCCTCVQCVCERSDGTTLAIFEHDDQEEGAVNWFGDRPETEAICSGKRCSLVQFDNSLAVTWNHGSRHITIVGVRDDAEADQLVAWFDDQQKRSLP